MSRISPEDRALIDAALAETPPEERRVPTGASTLHVEYIWRNNKLEAKDPDKAGWRARPYVRRAAAPRRSPWSMSDAKRAAILADLDSGMRVVDVAERHEVTTKLITNLRHGPPPRRPEPVDRAAVIEALDQGMTYRLIAEKCGCSMGSVGRIARAHGRGKVDLCPEAVEGEALTACIVALVDGVRTVPVIAKLAGCNRDAVRLRRDKLGLDIPNGASGRRRKAAP